MEVVGRPYNVYNPKQARLDLDSMILDILLRYLVVFDDSNELQGYQQPTMLSYPGSFEWEIKLVDHAYSHCTELMHLSVNGRCYLVCNLKLKVKPWQQPTRLQGIVTQHTAVYILHAVKTSSEIRAMLSKR